MRGEQLARRQSQVSIIKVENAVAGVAEARDKVAAAELEVLKADHAAEIAAMKKRLMTYSSEALIMREDVLQAEGTVDTAATTQWLHTLRQMEANTGHIGRLSPLKRASMQLAGLRSKDQTKTTWCCLQTT